MPDAAPPAPPLRDEAAPGTPGVDGAVTRGSPTPTSATPASRTSEEHARDEAGTGGGTERTGAPEDDAPLEPADPALRAARRPATSLLTLGTVALVLVIVIVLVVIKVTGKATVSTPGTTAGPSQAPAAVVQAVTRIRPTVYDTVGVTSSVAAVTPPTLVRGQPALESGGKPEVVFVGNEFCPYCAAERWALVAALSRFGKFTVLNAVQSAGNEAFADTPTFTFYGSHYTSRYVSTTLVEQYGTQKNASGTGFAPLERLGAPVKSLMTRYDRGATGPTPSLVPFVDIANRGLVGGGSFSPSIFQQLSQSQIASGLTDAKDPTTQAIVATANYISAVICAADGQRPGNVCESPGVMTADAALGLAP